MDGCPPRFTDYELAVQGIVLGAGREAIVTENDLSKIDELQAKYDSLLTQLTDCDLNRTNELLHSQRDSRIEAAAKGEKLPTQIQTFSREQVQAHLLANANAIHKALILLTHTELLPLGKPILDRFYAAIKAEMASMEAGERELCAGRGIAFEPGILWKSLAILAQRYKPCARIPKSHAWATPGSLLAGIITTN